MLKALKGQYTEFTCLFFSSKHIDSINENILEGFQLMTI